MKALPSYPNPALARRPWPDGVPRPTPQYRFWRCFFKAMTCALCQVRIFNRHFEPASGSVVYICNHQSFLDPVLIAFALRRPMNFMARDSLFRVPLFGRVITSVNAFAVRRGTADISAVKESLRRLKAGGQVAIFPEGTRSQGGRIGQFLPGLAVLSQRAADWTVPVVIDGASDAWPRGNILPVPGNIVVQYAPPIPRAEASAQKPEDFVAAVRAQIIEMQQQMRARLGRPAIRYT